MPIWVAAACTNSLSRPRRFATVKTTQREEVYARQGFPPAGGGWRRDRADRVDRRREDDGIVEVAALAAIAARVTLVTITATCGDQVGHQPRQRSVLTLRPAVLDLTFSPSTYPVSLRPCEIRDRWSAVRRVTRC